MRAGRLVTLLLAAATAALSPVGAAACATAPAASVPLPPAGTQLRDARLVDRIAAIVNGEVITLAQVNRALRLQDTDLEQTSESCTAAPGPQPSPETRMLQCMIDGLLMFQHVRRFPQFDVLAEDLEAQYQRLVDQHPSRQAFEDELQRLQLTPGEVRYDLERQALIANYIDLRYRDVVDVGDSAKRRYYDEVLGPEMERQGAAIPPFEEVADEFIEPILVEMEVNRRVEEWIADLRRRADITVYLW